MLIPYAKKQEVSPVVDMPAAKLAEPVEEMVDAEEEQILT